MTPGPFGDHRFHSTEHIVIRAQQTSAPTDETRAGCAVASIITNLHDMG